MDWLLWLLLAPLALVLALAFLGLLYQFAGERVDRWRFPPPGRRVKVDGNWLHYVEAGPSQPAEHGTGEDDAPVVLLEAGISASSLSWSRVMPDLARHTRVIAYDRGGLAWSGPTDDARLADRMVLELEGLLEAAQVRGPLFMVGHSYGALLCMMFAAKHRERVAGLVLVDPVVRCEWLPLRPNQAARLRYGVRMALRGALLAKLGVVRFSLALLMSGARAFPQAVSKAAGGRASNTVERLVGEVKKLPPECWPMVRAHWSVPKTFFSMASHMKNLPESISQYDPESFPPHVPLTVLSAESAGPYGVAEHHADAERSLVGVHRVVPESGHWIHLDQPDEVTEEVLRLVRFVASLKQPA
ncbi:MAG: alpha/beta hydrolase [Bryobacterales bacterium]|nr:alpha/beta hydrolase [Bryobacterales bacterium]